jgi:hypothetical protein
MFLYLKVASAPANMFEVCSISYLTGCNSSQSLVATNVAMTAMSDVAEVALRLSCAA